MAMQEPDSKPGAYYVTAQDAGRTALLFGPFMNNHAAALEKVEAVRNLARDVDPRSVFYAFGTCRLYGRETYPVGSLNELMGLGIAA